MSPDLGNPLLGDVVKRSRVDHAEAQEEDICVGVGQSPEFIKLFLNRTQNRKPQISVMSWCAVMLDR